MSFSLPAERIILKLKYTYLLGIAALSSKARNDNKEIGPQQLEYNRSGSMGLPRHFVPRNDRIGCVKNNIKVIIQRTKYLQYIFISLAVMKASCKCFTPTLVLPPQGGGNKGKIARKVSEK